MSHALFRSLFFKYVVPVACFCLSVPAHSQLNSPSQPETIIIDGQPVAVTLTPHASNNKVFASGEHFVGAVGNEPDSWVRLSRVGGQWQGLVSMQHRLYLIEPAHRDTKDAAHSLTPEARALDTANLPFACGVDEANELAADNHTLQGALRSTSGSFTSLCNEAIDGTCGAVELDMVFDRDFVDAYPDDHEAQAASLINMVEGYYADGFGLRLDTLSVTFLEGPRFTADNTSSSYLDDIARQKSEGTLAFVTNPRAITHVVKGKPFTDDTTAGIAWVRGLCDSTGLASGTSVLYRDNAYSPASIPVTALVATHEIGHNLGAEHDNTGSVACPSGFIMDPVVSLSATGFSSCSKNAIRDWLGDLSSWRACTDYPVKMAIYPSTENPLTLETPDAVTHHFEIAYQQGYATPSQPQITAALQGAIADSATLAGVSCDIRSNGTEVVCPHPRQAITTLTLTLRPEWAQARISLQGSTGSDGNFFNVADDGGVIHYQLDTKGPGTPTLLLARKDDKDVRLTWEDNAKNETGYIVQRRIDQGEWETIATLGANADRYVDRNIPVGDLDYRVQAISAVISSAPSDVANVDNSVAAGLAGEDKGGGGGGSLPPSLLLLTAVGTLLCQRQQRNARRKR